VVESIARRTITQAKLSDRVDTLGGDFLAAPLPKADVIIQPHRGGSYPWPELPENRPLVAASIPESACFSAGDQYSQTALWAV
jgi:hypothetical protein